MVAGPAPFSSTPVRLVDLDTKAYEEVWALQKRLAAALAQDLGDRKEATNTLVLVEHPHVYTLGRRGREGANLLDPGQVPVLEVERGGDVTYHGPGQLVAYPLLRLEGRWRDVGRYMRALEAVVMGTVAGFDLPAGRRPNHPGVWVVVDENGTAQPIPGGVREAGRPGEGHSWRKLASVGVAISRWVTYHGLALNVSTDLSYFARINPCGLPAEVMTSMTRLLGRPIAVAEVKPRLVEAFETVFGVATASY